MKKKILDTAVVMAWICLMLAVSNIQEERTETVWAQTVELPVMEPPGAVAGQTEPVMTEVSSGTAGVSRILVPDSFTTESGERAKIEKNSNKEIMITSSGEEDAAESEEDAECKNRWEIILTEDEIDLLARIVWLESCGEPVLGQEAVVEVVFNRIASDLYPDTLYEVLSQTNPVQFCSWKNRDSAEPTEKEYDSIYEVLNGNTNILRNDTLYFSTEPLTSNIDVTIGGHSFCY
ncbi:MAG: cell wall hydrolase [Roseburia sp.]